MYFVHPQIQLKDLGKVVSAFFKKPDLEALQKQLSFYFPEKQIIFTDMGRTAFRIIVEKLALENSQILMPAYICDIFFPILKQYNITPIFLDIDLDTFNIRPEEIGQRLASETKAILISHTYGKPVDLKKIQEVIVHHPLFIIEDRAHTFAAKINGVPDSVGNFGDVAFFSLYKQFPALRGGMLICPKDWQVDLPKTHFNFRDFISLLNCFPFFAFLFKKFGGKVAPKMLRKEKLSRPASINKISLNLFSGFLPDFEKNLEKRKTLARLFQKELQKLGFQTQQMLDIACPTDNVFCFLSALVPKYLAEKRDTLVQKLRKHKIFCTRIWHTPIILNPEAQQEYNIDLDNFPNAVEASKRTINFPLQNYYQEKDISQMIQKIKKLI